MSGYRVDHLSHQIETTWDNPDGTPYTREQAEQRARETKGIWWFDCETWARGQAQQRTRERSMSERAYKPNGYTAADQRSDTAFLVGVNYGRAIERAELDDSICDAIAAAKSGRYDGLTVDEHLENLIERLRKVAR